MPICKIIDIRSILGTSFMRSHNTLFDIENKRIGMIRNDCNFVDAFDAIEGSISAPEPYANYDQIIKWYNKNRCHNSKDNCGFSITKISINLLCLLFLCLLVFWKPSSTVPSLRK